MATAFRIHEDIENVLEPNKKAATGKNNGVTNDKNEKHQQRPTFAILNNVGYDGGRNVVATHAQKSTVSKDKIKLFWLWSFFGVLFILKNNIFFLFVFQFFIFE